MTANFTTQPSIPAATLDSVILKPRGRVRRFTVLASAVLVLLATVTTNTLTAPALLPRPDDGARRLGRDGAGLAMDLVHSQI